MGKKKIFNDPIYGFINFPYEIIYELIDHPWFQRLRRIGQMGLSHYVYPGAIHTRFHHALGSTHLMIKAIQSLQSKGVEISEEEAKAVSIAILLHDIGHGPFSHGLERLIIDISHEELSLKFMYQINKEMNGSLDLAIKIFKNEYEKEYLHQLVSSQLDMDRMDYLNRDSFFTGVAEGVIGYDRIIHMLDVRNNKLVVEEKGLYSVQKFLISRWIMYWQVYLHKTSFAAEQMMIKLITNFKEQLTQKPSFISESMYQLLSNKEKFNDLELLELFSKIDDIDIVYLMKSLTDSNDEIISMVSKGIINRNLFRIEIQDTPIPADRITMIKEELVHKYNLSRKLINEIISTGNFTNQMYNSQFEEITILNKKGDLIPLSQLNNNIIEEKPIIKYFFCYPKL